MGYHPCINFSSAFSTVSPTTREQKWSVSIGPRDLGRRGGKETREEEEEEEKREKEEEEKREGEE